MSAVGIQDNLLLEFERLTCFVTEAVERNAALHGPDEDMLNTFFALGADDKAGQVSHAPCAPSSTDHHHPAAPLLFQPPDTPPPPPAPPGELAEEQWLEVSMAGTSSSAYRPIEAPAPPGASPPQLLGAGGGGGLPSLPSPVRDPQHG